MLKLGNKGKDTQAILFSRPTLAPDELRTFVYCLKSKACHGMCLTFVQHELQHIYNNMCCILSLIFSVPCCVLASIICVCAQTFIVFVLYFNYALL